MYNEQFNYNNQLSYHRWTWIVALLLAFVLLWMLFTGHGPSNVCCAAPLEAKAPTPAMAVAESFSFSASCNDFSNKGDATWVSTKNALEALLCDGESLKAEGDDKHIVLTGIAESEAKKTKIGEDVQAFFGAAVAADNQITVKAVESVVTATTPATK